MNAACLPLLALLVILATASHVAIADDGDQLAWYRDRPAARAALVVRLRSHPDDESLQRLAWQLLEQQMLTESEISQVLDHAFNLILMPSGEELWWVFERRTAPLFVYIQPRKYALWKDGRVVAEQTVDIRGNGVEVHPNSSGRGPFAGRFPRGDDGELQADEFRMYYEVTYAPTLEWLEGYESFLRVSTRPDPVVPVLSPAAPPVTARSGCSAVPRIRCVRRLWHRVGGRRR